MRISRSAADRRYLTSIFSSDPRFHRRAARGTSFPQRLTARCSTAAPENGARTAAVCRDTAFSRSFAVETDPGPLQPRERTWRSPAAFTEVDSGSSRGPAAVALESRCHQGPICCFATIPTDGLSTQAGCGLWKLYISGGVPATVARLLPSSRAAQHARARRRLDVADLDRDKLQLPLISSTTVTQMAEMGFEPTRGLPPTGF